MSLCCRGGFKTRPYQGHIVQEFFLTNKLTYEPLAKVSMPLRFHQTIPGNLVAQAFQPVLIKD
jgi:hypothetical protein